MRRSTRVLIGGSAAIGAGILAVGPLSAAAHGIGDDWVGGVLDGLVEDGTLTQEQATAVDEAFDAARPEHGPGDFGHGRALVALDAAADAIGIDETELLEQLRDGSTLAEIAEANGVEPQAVIDALVAAAQTHLDEAVADGRLTEDEAAERATDLEERITEGVNEGFGFGHHGPRGPGGPGRGPGWWSEDRATDEWTDDTDEPADDTTPTTEDTTAPTTTG